MGIRIIKPYKQREGLADESVKAVLEPNEEGGFTVYVPSLSSPDGKRYKEILVGIDRFINHRLMDEKTLLLVFQPKETGFSANVDLTGFEVYNETELPKVGSETVTITP